jgi:bifunctional non-homologous end joining protein LigD
MVDSALDLLDDAQRELTRAAAAPRGSAAMKAVLCPEPFNDRNWVFERKLDGVRAIAVRDGGRVRLWSRNDLSLDGRYPELIEPLGRAPAARFAVDGEVVAFDGTQTSFEKLARRGREPVPVFLYVFDVLWIDGVDVRGLDLLTRKRLLRATLTFGGPIRFTTHRNTDGEVLVSEACAKGWEGLVAKRRDSVYAAARSRDWLKLKCTHGQELVVGGFTAPRRSRQEFGALLVGYYRDGELHYAGKVGTGFDTQTLHDLGARMRSLAVEASPFADAHQVRERDVTWTKPRLVAQVGFSEWTRDGRLRHPRYLGLRDDKAARDVVRES